MNLIPRIRSFFYLYPALRYALLLLCAAYHSILYTSLFLIFCMRKKERFTALSFMLLYTSMHPPLEVIRPTGDSFQNGIVHVHTITQTLTPTRIKTVAKGTLRSFDGIETNIPVTLSLPAKNAAKHVVHIASGSLSHNFLRGKVTKATGHSLPAFKHALKKMVCSYISSQYPSALPRALLQSTIGATPSSFHLQELFRKTGLSHLLAISGFHYAFLLSFFFILVPKSVPSHIRTPLLLFLLLSSLLYFDATPSVIRAFLMAFFALVGIGIGRKPSGLNMLGVALLLSLFFDPQSISSIGFCLSHTACLAILLTAPLYKTLFVQKLFFIGAAERSFYGTKEKGATLLLYAVYGIFSIAAVATLSTTPILLATFGKLPLFGIIYNLYFPPVVSATFLLFSVGLLFPPIHTLNNWLLSVFLQGLEEANPLLYQQYETSLSPEVATFLLVLGMLALISYSQRDLHIDKYHRNLVYS